MIFDDMLGGDQCSIGWQSVQKKCPLPVGRKFGGIHVAKVLDYEALDGNQRVIGYLQILSFAILTD